MNADISDLAGHFVIIIVHFALLLTVQLLVMASSSCLTVDIALALDSYLLSALLIIAKGIVTLSDLKWYDAPKIPTSYAHDPCRIPMMEIPSDAFLM